MTSSTLRARAVAVIAALVAVLLAAVAAPTIAGAAEAPDPFDRGPHAVTTMEPYVAGTVNIQEPNATGGAPTGASAAVTLQVRGSAYYPTNRTSPSPLLVLVHGNHGSCDFGSAPSCSGFKRNERGYAYMANNLASWGYTVLSISQDQLMNYQDGTARGMHNRRLMIAATLDAFYAANQAPIPDGPNSNLGSRFVGKIDFSRIGLMGHSRGGDVVTSYIDYNRTRPNPGRRYDIRGVIALAPTDFERKAPYGTPFLAIQPLCDGDVTPQHGSRMFERGQVVMPGDPFPKIQYAVNGANHNWFNTVWRTDSEDASGGSDAACTTPTTIPQINANSTTGAPIFGDQDPNADKVGSTTIRLSGNGYYGAYTGVRSLDDPASDTFDAELRGSGDQARMGDQQKIGFTLMNSFFRRYVGGETAFDPYMTGEQSAEDGGPQFSETACPTSVVGMRISCEDRVMTNYYAGATERKDVIGPLPDNPLGKSSLGTAITGSGFSNPFRAEDAVQPVPATTPGGYDWCNPEAAHYTPSALGLTSESAPFKSCPAGTAFGQVNRNWGLQYALAWDDPVVASGAPAKLTTRIPVTSGDVTGYKALTMAAGVNFWDTRNPERTPEALWNPSATTQDFTIALTDSAGREATVAAADPRYGNALHQTIGSTSGRVHVVLNEIRVPLADFAAKGVDLTKVRKLELRFGEDGKPRTGSIQLSDVGFQELATGPAILADTPGAAGPATGPVIGPDPGTFIAAAPRIKEGPENPEPIGVDGAFAVATPAKAAACVDTIAPKSAITSRRVVKGSLVLTGTAKDVGCGTLASVQVGLYKKAGAGKLKAVKPNGRIGKAVPAATAPVLVAKGKARWTLKIPTPAKGTYVVALKAIDGAGNVQAPKARTLTVR